MSGNYALLNTKAATCDANSATLHQKKVDLTAAEHEATQAKTVNDITVADLAKREGQVVAVTAEHAAAVTDAANITAAVTADFAELTALMGVLGVDGATPTLLYNDKKEADDAIAGIRDPVAPHAGTLKTAVDANQGFIDARDTANVELLRLRNLEEQQVAALAVAEQNLADAVASDPSGTHTALELLVTNAKDALDAVGGTRELIAAEITAVSDQDDLIGPKEVVIAGLMADLREHQATLATVEANIADHVSKINVVVNRLENAVGGDTAFMTPYDITPGSGAIATLITTPNVASRLAIVNADVTALGLVKTQYTNLHSTLDGVAVARASAASTKESDRVTAAAAVVTAETTLQTCKAALAVLIETQKNVEVDAAVALLEDFLKNGDSIVTSAAPTIPTAVETLVGYTCPSSKVRTLVSQIEAAYANEAEYVALRAQFLANPGAAFFHALVSDPCFASLSPAEVEALSNQMVALFAVKAAALFAKYFPQTTATTTSLTTLFVILGVLAVVVLVALLMYYRM